MVICQQFVNRAAAVGTLREGEDVCEHHTWEAGGAQGPVTGPGSGEELGRGGRCRKSAGTETAAMRTLTGGANRTNPCGCLAADEAFKAFKRKHLMFSST